MVTVLPLCNVENSTACPCELGAGGACVVVGAFGAGIEFVGACGCGLVCVVGNANDLSF